MWQWWLDSWIYTHIEVLQLGFGRSLIHKLQNRAQIANIDASLAQGLGQRGSVHGQSAVVQTVFNLVRKHTRTYMALNSNTPPESTSFVLDHLVPLTSDGT